MSQAWKNLPATWLTASPVGSRHAEQHEDAVDPEDYARIDAELTAAEELHPSSMLERIALDSAAQNKEAQPDADCTVDARGQLLSSCAPLQHRLSYSCAQIKVWGAAPQSLCKSTPFKEHLPDITALLQLGSRTLLRPRRL